MKANNPTVTVGYGWTASAFEHALNHNPGSYVVVEEREYRCGLVMQVVKSTHASRYGTDRYHAIIWCRDYGWVSGFAHREIYSPADKSALVRSALSSEWWARCVKRWEVKAAGTSTS